MALDLEIFELVPLNEQLDEGERRRVFHEIYWRDPPGDEPVRYDMRSAGVAEALIERSLWWANKLVKDWDEARARFPQQNP